MRTKVIRSLIVLPSVLFQAIFAGAIVLAEVIPLPAPDAGPPKGEVLVPLLFLSILVFGIICLGAAIFSSPSPDGHTNDLVAIGCACYAFAATVAAIWLAARAYRITAFEVVFAGANLVAVAVALIEGRRRWRKNARA
jgi:hypothetical protein